MFTLELFLRIVFTHKTQKFIRFRINILLKRIDLKTEFKVIFYLTFLLSKEKFALAKETKIAFR